MSYAITHPGRSHSLILPALAFALPLAAQGPVSETPDLLIGTLYDDVGFYRIASVDVDRHGRIWVLDEGNKVLYVFDNRGNLTRRIGREGSGPGEFRVPAGAALTPTGIAVFDLRLQRLTYFDSAGNVASTYNTDLSASEHGWLYRMERLPNGQFIAELRTGCGYPRRPQRDGRLRLVTLEAKGEITDTLISTTRRDRLPYYGELGGGEFCTALPAPYPNLLLWDRSSNGALAFADGARYSIEVRNPGSARPIRIEREIEPIPITRRDRERYENRLARPEVPPAERRYVLSFLSDIRYPPSHPVIDNLRFDQTSRLWVRQAPGPGSTVAVWDVFDQKGAHTGSMRLPAAVDVRAITEMGFVGIFVDPETDVQQIVRYPTHSR